MKKLVLVFDLDDTLYPELTFVYSGFRAVSRYLSPIIHLSEEKIFQGLKQELVIQRTMVFNRFLAKHGKETKKLVNSCLSIYRLHEPQIELSPEAIKCLALYKTFPLYVVTDGNKIVQKRKFIALGLASMVRRCFCTYQYGLHRSKPSPYCFERICQLEKVQPEQVVYIADNPAKDFVGIKPLGFHTIRVLTGAHKEVKVDPSFEAEFQIANLSQLDRVLTHQLKVK